MGNILVGSLIVFSVLIVSLCLLDEIGALIRSVANFIDAAAERLRNGKR